MVKTVVRPQIAYHTSHLNRAASSNRGGFYCDHYSIKERIFQVPSRVNICDAVIKDKTLHFAETIRATASFVLPNIEPKVVRNARKFML